MHVIRLLGQVLGGTTLLLLLSLLTVGCGANSTSTSTSAVSSSPATTTPCPSPRASGQFQATIGTIQSISGNTLQIASVNGSIKTVIYSSSTRFLRESTTKVSSLQEGTPVTVAITQNADNTYSVTRIMLVNRSLQTTRQRTNVNANCFNRSQFNNPGGTQSGGGATANTRAITGTVGQVNGNTLTVTDLQGNDYTLSVTSTTQILQTVNASAADLKTGTALSVSGSPDGQGAINARTVTILPKLLTRSAQ